MKKIVLSGIIIVLFSFLAIGQSGTLTQNTAAELYIDVIVPNRTALEQLGQDFVIDKASYNEQEQSFTARVWLPKKRYADFEALLLPYSIVPTEDTKYTVTLASSYTDMIANWDKYPTYPAYLAIMDSFQSKYPQWCTTETVLNATSGGRKILAAHLGSSASNMARPAFLYSSTMHGDEVSGYYLMLRLIHYLLSNAANNAQVQNILNNVDLWIIPLINPDGTYYSGNTTIGSSPTSTRSNRNGVDINRSFPKLGSLIAGGSSNGNYELEIQAMMDFFNAHPFVMSANLHGGAELYNYPWDTYRTNQRAHPDRDWFYYLGRKFATTCQAQSSGYFDDNSDGVDNGVTEGGDWYVITGSQQDWANYAGYCKEVTIEVSTTKVVRNNQLNTLWNNTRQALLDYIEQSLYGLRGIVTDSLTGAPLAARVFIPSHDADHSDVYSHLPLGNYHRPIKEGSYTVQYSAEGYRTKTYTLAVTDDVATVKDVQLVPLTQAVVSPKIAVCRIYPNPANDYIIIESEKSDLTVEIRDVAGKLLNRTVLQDFNKINIRNWASGIYFVSVIEKGKIIDVQKLIKSER